MSEWEEMKKKLEESRPQEPIRLVSHAEFERLKADLVSKTAIKSQLIEAVEKWNRSKTIESAEFPISHFALDFLLKELGL